MFYEEKGKLGGAVIKGPLGETGNSECSGFSLAERDILSLSGLLPGEETFLLLLRSKVVTFFILEMQGYILFLLGLQLASSGRA